MRGHFFQTGVVFVAKGDVLRIKEADQDAKQCKKDPDKRNREFEFFGVIDQRFRINSGDDFPLVFFAAKETLTWLGRVVRSAARG